MNDGDLYPVRDTGGHWPGPGPGPGMEPHGADAAAQRAAQESRMISRWSRDELEDKYLRMYEENLILKKHARKQEDKIKRMATKLLRLVADKKKEQQSERGTGKRGRDIETEEMIEDLHDRIRDLEKQNNLLKEKVMVTKQQLSSQGKRHTPYNYVPSRINTGIPKPPVSVSGRVSRNIRVAAPPREQSGMNSPTLPRYGHSLLEEAREENRRLEEIILNQQEQCANYEQDSEVVREEMRMKELGFEEDLLKIKQQMTLGQRSNLQENVDLIRLQREIKEKSTKMTALQTKYGNLEQKLHTVTRSHEEVLREMEDLNFGLKEEENRVLTLQNELKHGFTTKKTIIELREQVDDTKKENEILREANEKLVTSAFDMEREREWRQRENQLKVQIAQLEATLKADVGEKGGILDKLTNEREEHESLEKEHRQLRIDHLQLREQYEELGEKMKFFTKESAIDFQEIEEALLLVKQKKEKGAHLELDFLEKVDEEKNKDFEKQIREVQAEYAETIEELEKTRNMLIVQHKINKDYQMEVQAVTQKMEENKQEYETKLEEYAKLLDIRQARIKKIEGQMKDVAYGTKAYKVKPEDTEENDAEEIDETIHLERGQNVFEIHVTRVAWSQEGLRLVEDDEPNTFCTWEFFEFETQATPVVKGARPEFDFTSQYVVTVDDFFLHHIQKESTSLELHLAFGTDYRTVAACQMKFRDLLDKPQGRVHGAVPLTGTADGHTGVAFGTLEYWVRLKVPMDQALRLYKERTKALGYLTSNEKASQPMRAMDESAYQRPEDNVNELQLKLISCSGLSARRKGFQPSPYAVYKLFDFPDHDTIIVNNNTSPVFNDNKVYPLPMTADLDRYLKSQPLQIYVFDDTDPEEASYLGVATVPLIALSHDKAIHGIFELKRSDGSVNGSLELNMKWQYTYIPPSASTKTPAQILATTPKKPDKPPLMFGEEESLLMPSPQVAGPASILKTPATLQTVNRAVPAAMSTPIPIQKELQPVHEEQVMDVTEIKHSLEPQQVQPHPEIQPTVQSQPIRALPSRLQEITQEPQIVQPPHPKQRHKKEVDFAKETSSIEPDDYDVVEEHKPKTKVPEPKPVPRAPPRITESKPKDKPVTLEDEIMQDYEDDDYAVSEVSEGTPVSGESEEFSSETGTTETKGPEQEYEEETAEEESEDDVVVPSKPKKAKKKVVKTKQAPEDTMFEDEISENDSIEEEVDIPEAQEDNDSPAELEEDSEGVVMTPAPRTASAAGQNADTVTVTISHLSLNEDSSAITNPNVQLLFVEYRFLGYPADELETPFALPKPKPFGQIAFNFRKVFHVDIEKNYERRQYLASMLLPDDPDDGRIRFTLVSEPGEENHSGECEDVGVSFVSVRDIIKNSIDLVEADIPIYSIDDESQEIGILNVTVECLAALKAVHEEMQL